MALDAPPTLNEYNNLAAEYIFHLSENAWLHVAEFS